MRNKTFAVMVKVKGLCDLAGTTFLLTAGLLITPAPAQTAQQWKCTGNADIPWDVQIVGCTTVISSGKYAGAERAWAYYNRGNAYRAKGENDRAIVDYDEAIRLDPDDPDSYNERCWTRALADRDLRGALFDCNGSLRLRPNDGNTLNSRGLVRFKLGAFKQSIADYDAALEQNANDAESLYARGVAKLKLRDSAGGNADIAAAKAIKADVADVYAGYGVK
jgi:tetratricopeptide (TPR) repeat protein